MKLLIFSILVIFSFTVSSQVYFNNNYPEETPNIRSIIETDTGYVIAGGALDDFHLDIYIAAIDSFGNFIEGKKYGDVDHHYFHGKSNSLIKTIDGGFALAGSMKRISDNFGGGVFN